MVLDGAGVAVQVGRETDAVEKAHGLGYEGAGLEALIVSSGLACMLAGFVDVLAPGECTVLAGYTVVAACLFAAWLLPVVGCRMVDLADMHNWWAVSLALEEGFVAGAPRDSSSCGEGERFWTMVVRCFAVGESRRGAA